MILTVPEMARLMQDASQLESDEPEMESSLHYIQLALLVACLEWHWRGRNDFFVGANLTIYYSQQQLRNRDFRGPDFFLIRNTEKRPRRSWVVWEENGRYPDIIIELLSESTARVDRNLKKTLYQNWFRTLEYFWFDPEDFEFAGFRLINQEYQAILPNEFGRLWSEVLELYLGIHDGKLRYFTADGELVSTSEESALQAQEQAAQAQEQAAQAQEQAAQAQERAERLANQLRALGIEPE
jgi:Uma2 family endonuclease